MIFLFFLWNIQLTWADCVYDQNNDTFPNTFEPSYIPSLIQQSQGCTTIVELWASWCGPCRMIVPQIDDLVQKYPNIVVHQISADEQEVAMKKFIAKHPLHSPPYRLSSWTIESLTTTFSLIGGHFAAAIPYILVVSPDGKIVVELTEPKNLQEIEDYLIKHPPPKKTSDTTREAK